MNDAVFQRQVIFVNALIPALLMSWDWARGRLGANPVEFVTRATGVMTLVFLVLTLLVTPLRKLAKWNWLLKHRRMIGLFAFWYGLAHLLTYVIFDRDLKLQTVPADVWQRAFQWLNRYTIRHQPDRSGALQETAGGDVATAPPEGWTGRRPGWWAS